MAATNFKLKSPDFWFSIPDAAGTPRTAGTMGVIGDTIVVWPATRTATEAGFGISWAEWITLPCASTTASTWLAGTALYYDATNAVVTIDPDEGKNRYVGVIHTTASADSLTVIDASFDGRAGAWMPSEGMVYHAHQVVTTAEINAGEEILPAVTGRTYTVVGYQLLCAGAAAGATAIVLADTASSPVAVSTALIAACGNGARISSYALAISNVTQGTIGSALTASKGVQLYKTGSTLTGTTSVTVDLLYTFTQ